MLDMPIITNFAIPKYQIHIMKVKIFILGSMVVASTFNVSATAHRNGANVRFDDISLMHESRDTPFPADGSTVDDRAVSFQWPMPVWARGTGAPLDGFEHRVKKVDKSKLKYKLRYSTDSTMTANVITVETIWPMHNPDKALEPGKYYWQYSFVGEDGSDEWSPVYNVTVGNNPNKFAPPSYKEFIAKLPTTHPRILVQADDWDAFIARSQGKPERQWYIDAAEKALANPMKRVEDIRTDNLANLTNDMQRNSYLTKESRRIIDAEEQNCETLIRAYILTKDRRYANEALNRILIMNGWDKNQNVRGDFNDATLLSLSTMAYDSFYAFLTDEQKSELLDAIQRKGLLMYNRFNNNVENHIAENHIWQMTLRITTMAALATYGELPESALWSDYCYNLWLARFPGLNKDGGWHNGDSYFTVNTRTLIEVPYYYTKISGYNFFADPWYENNVMYTIYQQPPFSKSGGNGSAHLKVGRPNSIRIGYLDALARILCNTYAADFVRRTLTAEPEYLKKAHLSKPGDLSWFRLDTDKQLPEGPGLTDLLPGYVFPETGLASFMTNWDRPGGNYWISFRSSPYGSTSHALANQNSFNTFCGGSPLFYSAGHHIEFTDVHAMICHRGTKAHNTILPNGMSQRIGVEGYGWIPRYYVSDKIGYVLGDASNAYGKVISPLWLQRGEDSGVEYTPENGWDDVPLKLFRRHIVQLGNTGYVFIYDELEADSAITWHYTLHAVANPLKLDEANPRWVHVTASNRNASSDAYIFSTGPLSCSTTDKFFIEPVNWLHADANGNFPPFPNHYHFTGISENSKIYRFATIINTHPDKRPSPDPEILEDGRIKVGGWLISVNLKAEGAASFYVRSTRDDVNISYKGDATIVTENGYVTTLEDIVPELEI